MHKIIHSDFQLDMSNFNLTTTEENHWFSDKFFTKYSYPFTIKLNEDLVRVFLHLINHTSFDNQSVYEIIYCNGNILEKGVLDIISLIGSSLSAKVRYGLEEFPNFDRKLSELDLETKNVEDIYIHAKETIVKGFPETNYNFVQIHTDNYKDSSIEWENFLNVINNYDGTNFLINESIDDVTYNRNILQPLPYILYVLKQGMALGGYSLRGDVLTDPRLTKVLLYSFVENFTMLDTVFLDLTVQGNEQLSFPFWKAAKYSKKIELPEKGRYRIIGTINLFTIWKKTVWASLSYNGQRLWYQTKWKRRHSGTLYYYDIELIIETDQYALTDEITFESVQFYKETNILCDLNVSSITLFDETGAAVPNVENPNFIDLNRTVPELTFGDLYKVVKNTGNFKTDIIGSEIWMTYVKSEINYSDASDLRKFEVQHPKKTFNHDLSFILKYKNEEDLIFYNVEGLASDDNNKNDKTKTIEIGAELMPLETRDEIQTVLSDSEDKGTFYLLMYDGLVNGLNLAQVPGEIKPQQLLEYYYKEWLKFRIHSINFEWSFLAWIEDLQELSTNRKIFCYANYFIIKQINRTEVKPDLFEIELEGHSIRDDD